MWFCVVCTYSDESVNVGDKPDAKGINDITKTELPAVNLSGNRRHSGEQECNDSEEENPCHGLVVSSDTNLPQGQEL